MKRILVGLDGSPRSPHVLAVASTIAKNQGAKLVLMRSVGLPPEVPQDLWRTTDEPLLEILRRTSAKYLEEQAATVPADLLEKTEVIIGVAWGSICDAAKRDDVDLIVVGSHGYSGLDHLIGTTAAKIVNHAHCSVLVVREPRTAK
ncbi:MAG: universal stress protein [Polyangiaceae bacterium]